MPLTIITGTASNVALGSDYSYAASQQGPVAIKNQLVSMRLNGKPVMFRTRSLPSISEGDQVSAAGTEKNGTLEALVLRNVTTGAIYAPPTISAIILAAILIIVGIPLCFIFIGVFFVGFGAWVLFRAFRIRKAVSMLTAPNMAMA